MSRDGSITEGPWWVPGPWSITKYQEIQGGSGELVVESLTPRDANLGLIVSAVNSCFTVSPSDPQAAAEAYPALVEAIVSFRERPWNDDAWDDVAAALAKVGR